METQSKIVFWKSTDTCLFVRTNNGFSKEPRPEIQLISKLYYYKFNTETQSNFTM